MRILKGSNDMDQQKTPLFEALQQHHNQKTFSFHVPGHKNGDIFLQKASSFYQPILSIDVTELDGLDDLHSPDGVIKEAVDLLTSAYQSKESYFLINGSTVGNLTMILASFKEGDIVFVQRNCHKSVLNGLKLAKLQPIFIEPDFNEEWKVATGITKATIEAAYNAYPNGKGIILTYPNYYGFTFDIEEIIEFCHSKNLLVLVDEAHGAHFIAGKPFPSSAIQLGADMVVQSAHKTLPAMTMAAFLHLNSNRVEKDKVKFLLQAFQSSSPSYPLMASLDLARSYIATYDEKDKEYLYNQLEAFINDLKRIPTIKVLHNPINGDLLKIAIQSNIGICGFELQKKLEAVGIYSELADPHNVLLVFPLLKKGESFSLEKIMNRFDAALQHEEVPVRSKALIHKRKEQTFAGLMIDYKSQFEMMPKAIPILDSVGKSSAEMVIPYPPGIPLLMEGEKITLDKVEELIQLIKLGAKFHGGQYLNELKIKVFE
jgi:arginine/lysine/ornithine decarboxylase